MKIKQVVVTGQNDVELQELELRGTPGPGEVLIRTEYSFISAGTELANYSGLEPRVFQEGTWCAYPWKSGYSNVGIVEAVGEGVSRVRPGQRVYTWGPHASHHIYNAERLVLEVPEELNAAEVAASRMAGVAATGIHVAASGHNRWVAVYGLGMVGNLAAQFFGIKGARVIGIDPMEQRRQLAERCGIPHTAGGSSEEVAEAIRQLTGGNGADTSVDAVGDSRVVRECVKNTASFGEVIILGSPRAPVQGDLTEIFSDVHIRWLTIKGALEWRLPIYPQTGVAESQQSKQEMIFDWMRLGKLQIAPLISHVMKPSEIKTAYEGLLHKKNEFFGVVLDYS